MIYIVEIPHQRPASCWAVHDEAQAVEAINATAIKSGEQFGTFEEAIKYNGADLSSQIVCSSDLGALACWADFSMWQRHGGAAARNALCEKLMANGWLSDRDPADDAG